MFKEHLEGKLFDELSIDEKERILNYRLTVDLVKGDKDEITEMFLRLNLSTTSLNPIEIINSQYFGDFKKLVDRTSEEYTESFLENKILTGAAIRRLSDYQLITSCLVHQLYGITNKKEFDEKAFKEYDSWEDKIQMDNIYIEFKKIYQLITYDIFQDNIKETSYNGMSQFISLFDYFHDNIHKQKKSLQKDKFELIGSDLYWLQKNIKMDGIGVGKEWYDKSVQGGDTAKSRHTRKNILKSILDKFFNEKDTRRNFSTQ